MNEELLEQFILEGRELVHQAFDDLLALERDGLTRRASIARSAPSTR